MLLNHVWPPHRPASHPTTARLVSARTTSKMDEDEVGRSRVRSRLPVIHKGLMSISIRFLGGKAFGISFFVFDAKKTRFDPNSIDLLLSMDRIERGAVVNLFTLVRFLGRLARRQTWNEGKVQRSCENGQNKNGGGPQSNSRWGHVGQPQSCARMLGGPGEREGLLRNHTLRAALSPCRCRAPRVCERAAGVCRAFESC